MTYIPEDGHRRWAWVSTTHQGAPGLPGAPRWVVPTSVASHTASSPYKFPNISCLLFCSSFIIGLWVLSNSFVHHLLWKNIFIYLIIITVMSLFVFGLSK